MRRAMLVTTVLFVSASSAFAGPYAGFGVGPTGTATSSVPESVARSSPYTFEASGRSGRVFGGYRFPKLPFVGSASVEASLVAYGLIDQFRTEYGGRAAMLTGKYSYPLGAGFEVFGRLGVDHAWITDHAHMIGRSGNGYVLGVGAEYRFKLPMAEASVFVDYTRSSAGLQESWRGEFTRDYAARMWTLGFSMGI
jgi:hypothetical protein